MEAGIMSLYKPNKAPLTTGQINAGYKALTSREQEIIDDQISRVDGELKRKKSSQQVGMKNGAGAKTGFGTLSGLELMAALGIWFSKVEEEQPEQWVLLLRGQRKPSNAAALTYKDGKIPNF
jgi:hypothetical protein